jgi:hypothetical protein
MESFAQQHSLSPDEVSRIRLAAGRMNVLDSLMSGIDPITGAPSKPDILTAVERSLEIAMYADPSFRSKVFQQEVKANRATMQKRKKLAGIGGNSGSAPRSTPPPENPHQAMLAEVASMFSGSWNEPT